MMFGYQLGFCFKEEFRKIFHSFFFIYLIILFLSNQHMSHGVEGFTPSWLGFVYGPNPYNKLIEFMDL